MNKDKRELLINGEKYYANVIDWYDDRFLDPFDLKNINLYPHFNCVDFEWSIPYKFRLGGVYKFDFPGHMTPYNEYNSRVSMKLKALDREGKTWQIKSNTIAITL